MTIEQRLEAIQALTKATANLSKSRFVVTDATQAIKELQNALEALQIEELNIDDSALKVAKKIMK